MRLTDLSIKRLRVPETGRVTYTDDTVSGFGVRVTASGVKTFTLMYGRNRKRVTIDVGQDQVKQRRHAASAQQASTEDALRGLVERRERGELTEDEFETQKRQLLS